MPVSSGRSAPNGASVHAYGGPCVLVMWGSVRGVMRYPQPCCVRRWAFCIIVNRSFTEDMGAKAAPPMTDCAKAPFVDGAVTDLTFKKAPQRLHNLFRGV